MYNYKLTIAYDGTSYSGWQVQPNAFSVQEAIVKALCVILQVPKISLIGSGRTDAGVHALGQVAHFRHENMIDIEKLTFSLNGMLPRDIRIKSIEMVPHDFHAQKSAISKEYHYYLYLDRIMDPFKRHYCWHVSPKVDLEILKEAAQYFVGTHDFTSFANEARKGSASRNAVRMLYRLDPVNIEGGLRLEFEGNGFLYKMVRNIVGTLVDIASGKRSKEDILKIIAAKDRRQASRAAPPQGLFLVRVNY